MAIYDPRDIPGLPPGRASRPLVVVGGRQQKDLIAEGNPGRRIIWTEEWDFHPGHLPDEFDFVVSAPRNMTATEARHMLDLVEDIRRCPGARPISVEEAEGRPGMTPGRICDSDAALGAMLRGTFMEQYLPDRDMLPDGRWVIRRPNGSVEIVDVHHQTVNNLPLTEFLERRGPEPTRTIPRICGWERRDATEPARVHENVHNLGTESGKPPDHRMGWKPGD